MAVVELPWVADETQDVVPALQKGGHQTPSHVTGDSRDRDPHFCPTPRNRRQIGEPSLTVTDGRPLTRTFTGGRSL
jgi:hypothetical protein